MKRFYYYSLALFVGLLAHGTAFGQVFLNEDFSTGTGVTPPAGWTNTDNTGGGGTTAAELWHFDNNGGQTLNAPITDPAAIFDSDDAGNDLTAEDAYLTSPAFDLSGATGPVILQYDNYFEGGFGGSYEVDVFDGTTWNQVAAGTATSATDPEQITIDITAAAAGSAVAQVRFRWQGDWSWYWILDNVSVYVVPTSPAITQDPGVPTCAAGTDLTVAGTPDATVEWYWQTMSGGTSTANPVVGPWTVFANGDYYVRAYLPALGIWAPEESITVSNFPTATPPTPIIVGTNPGCLSVELTMGAAPAQTAYFWQGTTMNGTDDSNPATAPFSATASGTYYVAAYDSTTQCWSNTVDATVTVETDVPADPTAVQLVYDICEGETVLDLEASTTIAQSQTFSLGTNLVSPGTPVTFTTVIPALPAGAVVTSADLVFTDVESINGSFRSEIRVELGNLYTLAPTQISTATSSGIVTPNPTLVALPGFPTTGGSLDLILSETFDDGGGDDATFGSVDLVINYTVPATIEWYDAATAGNNVGSGSPFNPIGTSALPATVTGTYSIFAEAVSGACTSVNRTEIVVNVSAVNVTLTAIDETCTGYNNGSFDVTDTLCGTTPFTYSIDGGAFVSAIPTDLTAGTYIVVVEDDLGAQSAPITLVINSTGTVIPGDPQSTDSLLTVCSGTPSIPIEATASLGGLGLTTTFADNNGCGGGNMFDITTNAFDVQVDSIRVNANSATTVDVYWIAGGYAGNQTNAGAWTFVGSYSTPAAGEFDIDIADFTIPASTTYGIYVDYDADYTNGTNTYSDANMTINTGLGHCSSFSSGINSRTFNGTVYYTVFQGNIEWFDANSIASNSIGAGSPLETVGTTVLPDPNITGDYEFYAFSELNGCYSVGSQLVTVEIRNVNVDIMPIDASCNNQANGSFDVVDTLCGVAPFTYSVDGGAPGAIPTDLLAGDYDIIVIDANGDSSSVYTITVGDALPPSNLAVIDITDNGGTVTWVANGTETEWYVEWGLPGFTPGTGTEIGSATAIDTFQIISGLDPNTEYEVYVAANCGPMEVIGEWVSVTFTTACGIYTIPFVETFEENSESRACWLPEYEVGMSDWTYDVGSTAGVITTAYQDSLNARFVSQIGTEDPITKLVSPRFDFSGQDSVALIYAFGQEVWFGDQNETKVYMTGASAVNWIEIQHHTTDVNEWTLDTLFLPDSVLHIAFEGINNWGHANVIDDIQLLPCTLNPGTDGSADVCRADSLFDLNSIVVKGEDFGRWSFPQNETFIVDDSLALVNLLPSGTYDFLYIVSTPCAADTTVATITVFGPSSAGVDGTLTACQNEPINLLSGLSGNIDLGGQWYDPMNNPTPENITASGVAGQFNYDYITGNGVCPDDTSNIVLTVLPDCDYLNLDDLSFEGMELYPNPTTNVFYISNVGSTEVFDYELTDLNGKVIAVKESAINGVEITEVNVEKLETGVYLIRVFNENAEKTFRVVKH